MEVPPSTNAEPVRQFDWTGFETVCRAVVETVATAADADPTEIEPLYRSVDPDAIEDLLDPDVGDGSGRHVVVRFQYHDYDVVLEGGGDGCLFEAGTTDMRRRWT